MKKMMYKANYLLVLFFCIVIFANAQDNKASDEVSTKVHTFYYGWFGNPEHDGSYNNWNHQILPHWRDTSWNNAGKFPGGDDIGANYFPELGSYSSNDPEIMHKHMKLIREAGIGVVSVSWWGPDSFTDKSLPKLLDIAHDYGLKINFHIEPVYKTIQAFKELIVYINTQYGAHPAFFRHKGKALYYIYDSGKVKYHQWNKLLSKDGEFSIRNTPDDAVFIGHWERERDGGFITKSGFDGFYTYYASEGFMYGCTSSNWPVLAAFAKKNNLLFIPCPGPGYIDTRIRPWNAKNTEKREAGLYYEQMFMNAVYVQPDYIGITSFNEWHEGTQIEPAVPKKIANYTYEDYGEGVDPKFYIYQTRELIEKYKKVQSNK